MSEIKKRPGKFLGALTTLIFVNFLFAWSISATSYVNSSFLATFFTPEGVSIVYIVASFTNILALFILPFIVGAVGVWPVVLMIIPLLQVSILFFGLAATAVAATTFFIIRAISLHSLRYLSDLYVESITEDETKTGNMRSLFITGGSIGVVLGPAATAILVFGNNYDAVYSFAALLLAPVFLIALFQLHKYIPHVPKTDAFWESFRSLGTCRVSVRHTMFLQGIYHIWNGWIIIYAPLYLVQSGFEWQFIGALVAIALIPYILLEIPLGTLADKFIGEKELMIAGITILAIATALLSLIPVSHIILWSIAFIATRIGGATLEVSTESYFFKQVDEEDSALISMFRMLAPIGGILAPLIALIILPITGLAYLFGFMGAIILMGIPAALRIHDTR